MQVNDARHLQALNMGIFHPKRYIQKYVNVASIGVIKPERINKRNMGSFVAESVAQDCLRAYRLLCISSMDGIEICNLRGRP